MRASPRSTPTSDSLRQVLTPNPYSSSTHLPTLPTLPLILTHMHLLYKVSVYLRATKRKVPPPIRRSRESGPLSKPHMYAYMSALCTHMETVARVLTRCRLRTCGRSMVARGNASIFLLFERVYDTALERLHISDILTTILLPMWSVFREVILRAILDISVYQWRRLVVKVSESDSSQLRKASPDSIPVAFTSGRSPLSTVPISNPLDDFRDTGEEKLSKNHIAKFDY
ncbi:hypothetical protein ALC62_04222 [Cyphomyrmex costatus]|uniref:Uncharacterized protein n=1 Tax=Cyphomyrmex costatus TaxID=456900 RepID=A0A195CVX8_9HYME|nr:hypothetical protein ALC62_04222 [Cyphomyrmex costatus]